MNTGLIFKVMDDAEESVKLEPLIDWVQIPNIMEKAEQDGITFEDAYIAILAHMTKHKISEIDFDISQVEHSIIRCDCCRRLVKETINLNLPYKLTVCPSCANKIENYVNSLSRKNDGSNLEKNYRVLSYKDIADVFGISVVFICINKDIDVFEKPLSGTMRRFEFQLDRECIYTFDMYKSSSKISPEALVKLHTALVRNVKEKEGK